MYTTGKERKREDQKGREEIGKDSGEDTIL